MKKENLIRKWLDLNLNADEQSAFEKLDADGSYRKISETAKRFKAPDFDEVASYKNLSEKITSYRRKRAAWKRNIGAIAAIFIVGFGLYFAFFNTNKIEHIANKSEQLDINLPDASSVMLNAESQLSYDQKSWEHSRDLHLEGEAYFKVAKGSTFTVNTSFGSVSVLGTQFNVKSRENYFEVSCFEGLVQVSYADETIQLPEGNSFRVIGNEKLTEKRALENPTWVYKKSSFKSVPLKLVLKELERQYNIRITTDNIDKSIIFTGSFTHDNLETALKAITIPFGITYEIHDDFVTLKKDI